MQYHAIPCNTMQYHAIPCIINNCWRSVPLPCGQYKAIFYSSTDTMVPIHIAICHALHGTFSNGQLSTFGITFMSNKDYYISRTISKMIDEYDISRFDRFRKKFAIAATSKEKIQLSTNFKIVLWPKYNPVCRVGIWFEDWSNCRENLSNWKCPRLKAMMKKRLVLR